MTAARGPETGDMTTRTITLLTRYSLLVIVASRVSGEQRSLVKSGASLGYQAVN